jgi:predicted O-linked N-acetylglucosamine transferase (SPINDLY family)
VENARLELLAPLPWEEYVRFGERVDLCLDPFPCNGMTTTCHALWMGLPVVSLAGTLPASRSGLTLLSTIGLPELVAHNEDEYIRIATELARDFPRLARLRATLRERMQSSPLMDAPGFARKIEAAYRMMWRRWCG